MAFNFGKLPALVQPVPEMNCWEFIGKRDAYGYGKIFSDNRELKAHRVFYAAWIQDIPENLFLRHGLTDQKCIGNACCFPFHMRLSPSSRRDAVLTPSDVYQRKSEMLFLIEFIPDTGCWQFKGPTDQGGYGRVFTGGKERKAHEVFFKEWDGPVPDDLFLFPFLDGCIGRRCCNPAHWQIRPKIWKREGVPYLTQQRSKIDGSKSPAQEALDLPPPMKCKNGHPMPPQNTVIENRNGHPKTRCRTCRQ